MFTRFRFASDELGEPALEADAAITLVDLGDRELPEWPHVNAELLVELAHEGLGRAFTVLELAAGKFPVARERHGRTAARQEHVAVTQDHARHDPDHAIQPALLPSRACHDRRARPHALVRTRTPGNTSMVAAADSAPVPRRRDFAAYLGGSAFWLAGFNLQQFLVTWMLVGMLREPGTRVGLAQLLIALPGFALMLLGGGTADRVDGRRLLISMHALAVLPPLALAFAVDALGLAYLTVIFFGIAVGALQGLSEPARVAMLNRVSAGHIHTTVVTTTTVTMTVGLAGTWLGGRIDAFGLGTVLMLQALLFGCGGIAVSAVSPALTRARSTSAARASRLAEIGEGLRVLWGTPRVRDVIGLNFVSSAFNAGAWFVVYPFLVTRLYGGDAAFLALLSLVFFAGSITSNLGLLRFVPLARPGRLFLFMQLTRVLLFSLLLLEPPIWVLALVSVGWGMNMGITTSTTRMMVQAEAPEAQRARVLSVFILTTMSAAPLGALMLGTLVDLAGVLAGFVPGVLASSLIFLYGVTRTSLWRDRAAVP